ncbi:hypothetical protein EAH72_34575 [Pseudomonas caspiana]|nr:hypothetical protein [Pseudomonas caspiana]TPG86705.1 hypothetical protein EAH72_34575 [Pseudomonas caspiana]
MSAEHKDKVVTKAEVVQLLQLWESKGHGVMSVVRVFTLEGNQILIGFTDYQDYETMCRNFKIPTHREGSQKKQMRRPQLSRRRGRMIFSAVDFAVNYNFYRELR